MSYDALFRTDQLNRKSHLKWVALADDTAVGAAVPVLVDYIAGAGPAAAAL